MIFNTPIEVLSRLYDLGISIGVDGSELTFATTDDNIPAELQEALVRHKAEIVDFISRVSSNKGLTPGDRTVVTPPRFPASAEQQSIYSAMMLGNARDYVEVFGVKVNFSLSFTEVRQAVDAILSRHELLRARFEDTSEGLSVEIVPCVSAEIEEVDFRDANSNEVSRNISTLALKLNEAIFDLGKAPLFRVVVAHTLKHESVLVFAIHHLICDTWSCQLIVQDFFCAYRQLCRGELPKWNCPATTYSEYVEAQRSDLELIRSSDAYWRSQLESATQIASFPDCVRDIQDESERLTTKHRDLEHETINGLRNFVASSGTTMSSVFLAVLASVLYRFSGQDDLLISVPLTTRRTSRHESLVGPCILTVPLRIQLRGDERFENVVSHVNEVIQAAMTHAVGSLSNSITTLPCIEPSTDQAASIRAGFVLHTAFGEVSQQDDFEIEYVHVLTESVKFDIEMIVNDIGGSVGFDVKILRNVIGQQTAGEIADGISLLLCSGIENPDRMVDELMLLAPEITRRITDTFNESALIPAAVTENASALNTICVKHPNASALIHSHREISYSRLVDTVSEISSELKSFGLRPGDLVGVLSKDPIHFAVAECAVLQAGATFMPMDASAPKPRISNFVSRGRLRFAISDQPISGPHIRRSRRLTALGRNFDWRVHKFEQRPALVPQHLAYVIYTSGSSGEPKGVMISHRAVVNTLDDIILRFQVGADDRIFALSKPTFDLAIFDIFGAFRTGAAVVFPEDTDTLDPESWYRTITETGVSIWNSVPVLFEILLEYVESRSLRWPHTLRLVLLSGDWIPLTLADRAKRFGCNARFISLGGATEAAIWSVFHSIDVVHPNWRSIPYGKPLSNQRLYVLNSQRKICSVGTPGDLYIGGDGLADGYLWDPERTSKSFVRHPELGVLYKSGDRALYWPDGTLEFLGRSGGFVKIGGYRIDPTEVAHEIQRHPGVSKCCVVDSHQHANSLVAFVILQHGFYLSASQLDEFARASLPSALVPSSWHFLDTFPLTENGKIDFHALRLRRQKSDTVTSEIAPKTFAEAELLRLCESILNAPDLSVDDDFFAAGGNSLLATRLSVRIYAELHIELSLREIFELRTIKSIANRVESIRWLRQQASAATTECPEGRVEIVI